MANSAKIKSCPKGKNSDDLRHLPNIGDHVVDPVAGKQRIIEKTWDFDNPNANLVEFEFEAPAKTGK
ncbi:hypothetical protein [Pseudomonas trivialis]|uniref:hypothetical protein n=1 Tax=Pseudomonas trivialis TaxID=200450 RepID=UPI000AB4932F|nr:hypothetical protein [Pseudomonas trivialis]